MNKAVNSIFLIYAVSVCGLVAGMGYWFNEFPPQLRLLRGRTVKFASPSRIQNEPTSLFRVNVQRTGVSEKHMLTPPLEPEWKTEPINIGIPDERMASPSVDDSGIYAGTDAGWFYAFDLDGRLRWKFRVGDSPKGIVGEPLLDKEAVYFGSYSGRLYRLRKSDGAVLWTINVGSTLRSSPLMSGGDLIFTAGRSLLGFAFRMSGSAGRSRWRSSFAGDGQQTSPAMSEDGQAIYFGDGTGYVSAIDSRTGALFWKFNSGGAVKGTPAVEGNFVYFTSMSGFLFSVDRLTGAERWRTSLTFPSQSSPALLKKENIVVVSSSDGNNNSRIWAVRMDSGRPQWILETDGNLAGSATLVYDLENRNWVAWMACFKSHLCGIDSRSGRILDRIELGYRLSGDVVIFHNALYAALDSGPLIKLKQK